ncbi:MAG: hypothetical protein MUC36_17975 [Planctomycetes bacterium]|nr:hypothetical protein [Planctomycetota bacterium]
MRRLATAVSLALLSCSLPAQDAKAMKRADHDKRTAKELYEVGKRHLDIGLWARDAGLNPQATTQFLRAESASQGQHEGARVVLGVMRGYGDAFWTRDRKQPPRALLADYQKRAAAADQRDRKSFVEIARGALQVADPEQAKKYLLQALQLGAEVELDPKGKHKVDGITIPPELAAWLVEQTIEVQNGPRRFEAGAARGFQLQGFREHASAPLIVRTDLSAERCQQLHTLASALLPALQERLQGAPTRPLLLLVFAQRTAFDGYLKSLGTATAGSGLCDYGSYQTIVSAEGLADDELHAMVLHELSHLYFWGTAPAAMPDWYAEGFAESFGGQGTFTWDGKQLQLGMVMRKDRLEAMRQAPLPLRELLDSSAERLLGSDRDKGLRFYAQSWALQRFLRQSGGAWEKRFAHWEALCRGAVLGAAEGRYGDAQAAQDQFLRLFGKDLDLIEQQFLAWLPTL